MSLIVRLNVTFLTQAEHIVEIRVHLLGHHGDILRAMRTTIAHLLAVVPAKVFVLKPTKTQMDQSRRCVAPRRLRWMAAQAPRRPVLIHLSAGRHQPIQRRRCPPPIRRISTSPRKYGRGLFTVCSPGRDDVLSISFIRCLFCGTDARVSL